MSVSVSEGVVSVSDDEVSVSDDEAELRNCHITVDLLGRVNSSSFCKTTDNASVPPNDSNSIAPIRFCKHSKALLCTRTNL